MTARTFDVVIAGGGMALVPGRRTGQLERRDRNRRRLQRGRTILGEIRRLGSLADDELFVAAKELQAPYDFELDRQALSTRHLDRAAHIPQVFAQLGLTRTSPIKRLRGRRTTFAQVSAHQGKWLQSPGRGHRRTRGRRFKSCQPDRVMSQDIPDTRTCEMQVRVFVIWGVVAGSPCRD